MDKKRLPLGENVKFIDLYKKLYGNDDFSVKDEAKEVEEKSIESQKDRCQSTRDS